MFRLLQVPIIRSHIQESKETILTNNIYSLRSQNLTVDRRLIIKFETGILQLK